MEGFELDRVDVRPRSQEGVEMEMIDPAGRPTGVILIVRGTDCAAYRDKLREQMKRGIDRGPRTTTEDERLQEFYELHATLIAGWKGKPLMRGGAPISYSPAAAAEFLQTYDWVMEQVRRFADRRSNFLPGSSST